MSNVYGIGWYMGFDVAAAMSHPSFVQSAALPDGSFGTQLASAVDKAASGPQIGNPNVFSSGTGSVSAPVVSAPALSAVASVTVVSAPLASPSSIATAVHSAPVAVSAPLASTAASAVTQSEYDAYWAAQPPAVRELQTIDDSAARQAKALQLAQEGYSIDYSIMVDRWDPLNTMATRKFYGYTWVPSVGQQAVIAGPGIHFPGLPVYNPAVPPAGSIPVSTDFAIDKTVPEWEAYNAVSSTPN